MFIGCNVIITSIGASTDVITSCDDEPMCRHTTVPSSEHARQNGSQWSEWKLGQPSFSGVLRERHRVAALRGDAAHLVGHQLRVPHRRQRSGMNRPG